MSDEPLAASLHGHLVVVRDDIRPGGTKTRATDVLLEGAAWNVAYASPAYGYAQIALAHGCRTTGRQAHIFTAYRNQPHPRTEAAIAAGARIHWIRPGYLTQTQAAARDWAAQHDATVLPFGFDTPAFAQALADRIRLDVTQLTVDAWDYDQEPHNTIAHTITAPTEVWVAAGSGTLTRALQAVWPNADHHAVAVGRTPDAGNATIHQAPEAFETDAKHPPPYPSTSNYDAKVWQFAQHRPPGTLIWNVAA